MSLDSSGDITFIGANFPTSGYTAEAIFFGVASNFAIITDANEVTATWDQGVPVTSVAHAPLLKFTETATGNIFYAKVDPTATLTNALNVFSTSSGLSCSFGGGCIFMVDAPGLGSSIEKNSTANNIQVCNQPCEYLKDQSDADTVFCKLDKLGTTYSNTQFAIEKE